MKYSFPKIRIRWIKTMLGIPYALPVLANISQCDMEH